MKKASKEKITSQLNIYGVLFAVVTVLLILCYGGFFEIAVVFAGLFATGALLAQNRLKLTLSQGVFLLFSMWYFICSLKNGFVTEYAVRGLLPFVVLLFRLYAANLGESKEKVKDIITEISLWISVISVILCLILSVDSGRLLRITFPFDYSNACGIYFAVCYFYADASRTKFLNRCKYIFVVALVLTQSVGAVGIFVVALLYCLVSDKKYIQTSVTVAVILIFVIVFRERVAQSGGTFLERLLHIYDGIICMTKNPVFGIGAGWWEHAKNYYQSGFYSAKMIHSSVVSIGVNSGFLGVALFVCVCFLQIRKGMRCKSFLLPAVMILVHSIFDFTLSFTSICVLLVLSLCDGEEKTIEVKLLYKRLIGVGLALSFVFFGSGLVKSAQFQRDIANGDYGVDFEKSFYLKSSVRANQCYAALMYTEDKESRALTQKDYKYMPTEMILYKSISEEGGEYLLQCLHRQPFNTQLRDFIISEYDDAAQKATQIVERATEKASFLGKVLYNLKGENK